MNTFGNRFRISIYGESHGEGVGVLIDGVKPGVPLSPEDFLPDLNRRKPGAAGTTARIEEDFPELLSGVYKGFTTGAPVNIFFKNRNTRSKDYELFRTHPRPGHADYAANIKYRGYNDVRGGGHFSGRLTLGIVAAGVLAKKMLPEGICISSIIKEMGELPGNGDSVGGIIETTVAGVPAGLGEPFFDSAESMLAHMMFSIPGVKGIEFGAGFHGCLNLKGSQFNDLIIDEKGTTATNNNGGINGGITNGNPILFRIAVKPTSSIFLPQETYSFQEGKVETLQIEGRHDAAFVLRVPVVAEAAAAIALINLYLEY